LSQQLDHASHDGKEERGAVTEDNAMQDAGSLSALMGGEMCPRNFHQTSSDDILDKGHWVSCDATLEINHRVTSVVARDPSSDKVNKPLLGDGAHEDDKSAVQVNCPPFLVPSHNLHVSYTIPINAVSLLDCKSTVSSTESLDIALQKGNHQRQKMKIKSIHQDMRQSMAPKHPRNTGWSYPFLEYDKSVVIKLLVVCLSECKLC
jgi:hypothetical protein